MLPTLEPGWFVLFDPNQKHVEPDSIVVARLPTDPETLIIKRARRQPDGDYWLSSENADEGSDSRSFGAVPPGRVLGPVTLILDDPRRPT